MSESPSPRSATSASVEDPTGEILKQGLAAIKAQQYDRAIAVLTPLSQNPEASRTQRLKARIGLIKGLKGAGQIQAAIAQCQPLTRHPQDQVQRWAQQVLETLTAIAPISSDEAPSDADLSGFRPLSTSPAPATSATSSPLTQHSTPHQTSSPEKTITVRAEAAAVRSPQKPEYARTPSSAASTADIPAVDSTDTVNGRAAPPTKLKPEADLFDPTATVQEPGETEAESNRPQELPTGAGRELEFWPFAYGGRLERLRPLRLQKNAWLGLLIIQVLTAIALFGLGRAVVQWGLAGLANGLQQLHPILPVATGWRYYSYTMPVLIILIGLLLGSPWILDWVLKRAYGQQTLTIQTLKQTHPEGCRLLRRIAQQRGWLLPVIRQLPTEIPLIFSYGWLPRYSRIVVSQGILDQLDDDEFATLIGYELAHFTTWTLPLMSLMATSLQLLYQGYWQAAQWGDRQRHWSLKSLAAAGAALAYTSFWVLQKISLLLSRVRVSLCDRQTVAWTGNPNGLVRSLIKLEAGIATGIVQAGYTPPLLESTDGLTPCSYKFALYRGSSLPKAEYPQLLNWDTQNPYRHWLSINSSHPLLGERLKRLTKIAVQWQLVPEISPATTVSRVGLRNKGAFWDYWVPFLQQISPFIAPVIGLAIAMLLWLVGGVLKPFGVWQVDWFYGDESLVQGGLLIGLGLGIMLRINRYFPDITAANRLSHPSLPSIVNNAMALPTDSRPTRLEGQLLGRTGMANWLCQDLILLTSTGLLKIHFLSSLGALGNLFIQPNHPSDWIGRSLQVQGWLRRGATPWLDAEQFWHTGKIVARSNHPAWSAVLSLSFCLLGVYRILQG